MSTLLNTYRQAIFQNHDAHERWPALFDIHADLNVEMFWTLFRDIIERGTFFRGHEEIIRRMLTAERVNDPDRLAAYTEDDIAYMKRAIRRGSIKIYRGGSRANMTGFAWTRDIDRARAFAVSCGQPNGTVVVGRLEPNKVIVPRSHTKDIICFADDVKIEKVYDVAGITDEKKLMETRLKILVASFGANHPLEMTPAQYFKQGIDDGRLDRDEFTKFATGSRTFLEPLGFKTRVATLDSILAEVV